MEIGRGNLVASTGPVKLIPTHLVKTLQLI